MILKQLTVGPLQANCYIVAEGSGKPAAVIDPGGDGPRIRAALRRDDLRPAVIIDTHNHIDHIAANNYLKDLYRAPLLVHEADAPGLTNPVLNLSALGLGKFSSLPPDRLLRDGDAIEVGDLRLEVLHTPGHTPGGICLLLRRPDEPDVVFTGDTLFAGGVGRTDFPGGSMDELMDSIRVKLLALPEETIIYPGHGPASTIGREKDANPFLI